MLILVESSCWIEFFRPAGNRQVQEQLRKWLVEDLVAVCGPVKAEVLRAARKPEVKKIQETFSALHYVKTTDEDWESVADKARALSDKGNNVPLMDVLIAVVASRSNVTLAHVDAHFDVIKTVVPFREHSFIGVK